MHGADIDDSPGLPGSEEPPHERLSEEKWPLQVHSKNPIVIFFGYIPEVGFLLHPGVVDQDVDRAESLPAAIDQGLYIGELRDIRADDHALNAVSLHLLEGVLGAVAISGIVDDDIGAIAGKRLSNRLPDPRARTSDQGNAIFQ